MNWTFRSVAQMIADLSQRMRDPLFARWNEAEVRNAINDSLRTWNGRVRLPMVYTLTDGWSTGSYSVTLPDYVSEPLTPQFQAPAIYGLAANNDSVADSDRVWSDMPAFAVDPDGAGGRTLRVDRLVDAPGRVLYWVEQGDLPTGDGAISGSHTATVTTLTLASLESTTPTHGAVLLNGSEWAFYAGVDWDNNQLLNVQRGVSGGASSLSNGATVQWGIAAPEMRLFNQLYDQAISYLHSLFLTDASNQERSQHERLIMFHQQRADMFWRTWTPKRNPRLIGGLRAWQTPS